jgi:hypothetical protein
MKIKSIIWKDKIEDWSKGIIQTYPKNIKKRFFYETTVCDKNMNNICTQFFITSKELEEIKKSDYSSFSEYINKSKNQYAISFYNKSKDTLLIIPIPYNEKEYITIKDFIDNAPIIQQKEFWKFASEEIKNILKKEIYISTHGLGVSYFHLRLCNSAKYYHTKL